MKKSKTLKKDLKKATFEMSKLETAIQVTKIVFGIYGLIVITIIMLKL